METVSLPVGPLQVNSYVLWNSNHDGLIVDPGAEPDKILACVRQHGVRPTAILLTHGHVDHIGAVPHIAAAFDIPVILHRADHPLYGSPSNALPPWLPPVEGLPQAVATEENRIDGAWALSILPTPGHTPGSVSYYFPGDACAFSGDALFSGSIGRTDLPGGDHEQLRSSLLRELMALPPQTRVYPGHGPRTTIGEEAASNPFLCQNGTV